MIGKDHNHLNLPGTPNTSSEYYMECAVRANDSLGKKEIKSKTIFVHKFLEFLAHLSRRLIGELIVYQ